jgi:Flp pilus assembly protein TadD
MAKPNDAGGPNDMPRRQTGNGDEQDTPRKRRRWPLAIAAGVALLLLVWFRAAIWREAGMLCLCLEKPSRAESCFRHALGLRPEDLEAKHGLGVAVGRLGRWREAGQALEEVTRRDPGDPDKHYNLGVAYDHLQRREEAVTEYTAALRLDPADVESALNLALDHIQRKRFADAIRVLERTAKVAPGEAEVQYELGLLYSDVGELDEAQRQLGVVEHLDQDLAVKLRARLALDRRTAPTHRPLL